MDDLDPDFMWATMRKEHIVLDSDKWDEFVALLDRDIEPDERLIELLASKPIWED